MIILTHNHHLNFSLNILHRRFILRCFLSCFLLASTNLHAESLNIAIFDTGFCPNLLPSSKLVSIAPTKDFTQSNDYHCQKGSLSSFRFHGQWVLKYLITHYHPQKKPKNPVKLIIHPYIVFNKKGDQRKSYWELALKQLKEDKINLALMATGLPVKSNELRGLTELTNQGQTFLFMASGQKDVRLTKQVKLFPQSAKNRLLALMFGHYYPALAKSEHALIPPALLNTREIDYFIPRSQFEQLKDSSLSVVQGLTTALNYCSYKQLKTALKLQECLKKLSHTQKAKFQNSSISMESLDI